MKETKLSPFDYIKSINQKNYMDDLSGFSPFLTAMNYSAGGEAYCFIANALNKIGMHKMSKRSIYDFYFYAIPQNKKWFKYPKKEKELKEIKHLQDWFGIDEKSAKTALELINEEELKTIIEFYENKGFIK